MKSAVFKAAVICWVLCLTLGAPAPVNAQSLVDPNLSVSLEARIRTDQDRKSIKGTSVDSVTQTHSLVFLLKGKPKETETRVGRWKAYGRDLKDKQLVSIESGEFPVDLSRRIQTVETKPFVSSYTPAYSAAASGGGRSAAAPKKTPAEGIKYVGFVVTVTDGNLVVGEYSEPRGLTEKTK
jgi:hypothetical protein